MLRLHLFCEKVDLCLYYCHSESRSRDRIMKFLLTVSVFLFVFASCSNSVVESSSREIGADNDLDATAKYDTVFTVDTVVETRILENFSKCRTDFDSVIVPGKSFFWGNSLLGGYDGLFGVSATNDSRDYFAHIKKFFESREIPFEAVKVVGMYENMSTIQEKEDYFRRNVKRFINDSTGLVVIQLGDNVDNEQEYIILKESIDLMLDRICSIAKNAKVLWVGEWYATDAKQRFFKEEAEKFGLTFVDISDLNIPENQSYVGAVVDFPVVKNFSMEYDSYKVDGDSLEISFSTDGSQYQSKIKVERFSDDIESKTISWRGYQYIVPNTAVATHPNDKAFKKIAERILKALGY